MELRDLRTFLTAVEAGGVTRAARRLHVVQSAASTAIKRLEAQLGVSLLERGRAGARPTEAGVALAAHSRIVLNQIDRAERDMQAFSAVERGTVRLGIVHTAVPLVLTRLVANTRSRHPGLRLEIKQANTPELADRLRERYLDLAILLLPLEVDDLEVTALAQLTLSVLMPVSHRLAGRREVDFNELTDERWVSFPPLHPGRRWLERACEMAHLTPTLAAEVETLEQVKAFVEAGAGIALLPQGVAEPERKAGTLHELHALGAPPVELAHSVTSDGPSPAVAAVRRVIEEL